MKVSADPTDDAEGRSRRDGIRPLARRGGLSFSLLLDR